MSTFIDFVLHLDRYLPGLVEEYGTWIYGLLFGIVFAETGFVVPEALIRALTREYEYRMKRPRDA